MAFVQFSHLSLAFGDRDILTDITLYLASGTRAALTGANGAGKSTLMKVIAGEITPDSGDRAVQKGCRVSYLPQSGIIHRGKTLREEAETAYTPVLDALSRMEAIGGELEKRETCEDTAKTAVLLQEHHRLGEEVEHSGYYEREQRIMSTLEGLGFSRDDGERPVEEFSGGWQMRIALAKALLESPDILLLDEPTNYLDREARSWLESWLQSFTGGYLLVSHDRYFLDVTIREVYELFQGGLKRYAGNYTAYETVRAVELESLLKRYAEQQEEIAKTEDLIRRFRYKATKAAMVQERIKKLDKMERIEIPESLKKIRIRFPDPPHAGNIALTITGLGKRYGERRVFSQLDLTIDSGEKLAVVGRNGAGKTTLLRILAGADADFEGCVQYGAGIAAGYFSQDAAERLNVPVSVLQYMEAEAPTPLVPKVRDMLGAFLFRGDDVYKSVSVLSGGEKSRLALLVMLLKPINLLILDEPTNHLDLHSKDILMDALKTYAGTVIFVSHDRGFMEGLSTKTLEMSAESADRGQHAGHTGVRFFCGNYGYYMEKRAEEEAERENQRNGTPERGKREAASAVQAAENNGEPQRTAKAKREEDKRRQATERRRRQREDETLAAIESLEDEKRRLERELGAPHVYSNGEKARAVQAELADVTRRIEEKTTEWEELAAR
ncbi:MAG: ABC-F family ATP-binding cassette domain-containing protein [Treponema sp.]|jgi:ATP-binding cassette subfamily F protein 3|nr:ABC-F family ATP-binding cassette domain-containing protein [Treponema sp.]